MDNMITTNQTETPHVAEHVAPVSGNIKVSAQSRPPSVAGAIAGFMRDRGVAEVQAIGAGAVNQAVKALAIARIYLQKEGIDVVCNIAFFEVQINGQERTAIRFNVEPRP
jgi:stage V sporulation protein S